jgi:hypothetical protein
VYRLKQPNGASGRKVSHCQPLSAIKENVVNELFQLMDISLIVAGLLIAGILCDWADIL